MNLVIDTGNTFAKLYIFQNQKIVARERFERLDMFLLDKVFKEFLIEASIYSHVGNLDTEIIKYLKAHSNCLEFNHTTNIPVKNLYETKETLGLDRLAAVCGAQALFPRTNVLCIDMGTCVTYDFLNADAEYLGGAISPGLQMRFKAMNTFTAKLPLISPSGLQKERLIGNSTESSIRSGAFNGLMLEINGFIDAYQRIYPDLHCLICGGDASLFDTQLKNSIFARPDLVAEGLNTILNYNVQNKT